jgi:hypothetical protein
LRTSSARTVAKPAMRSAMQRCFLMVFCSE